MRAKMKTIGASFVPLIALLLLGLPAAAQTPGTQTEPAPAAGPAPAAPTDDALFTEPPLLSDEEQPPRTPITSRKPAKRGKESISVDEIKVRILMRKAKTKALSDPKLHELLAQAELVKTDPEKRAILRSYYELLYKRMKAANPDLSPFIAQQRTASLAMLESPRLRDLGLDVLPEHAQQRP